MLRYDFRGEAGFGSKRATRPVFSFLLGLFSPGEEHEESGGRTLLKDHKREAFVQVLAGIRGSLKYLSSKETEGDLKLERLLHEAIESVDRLIAYLSGRGKAKGQGT
jgi:hypothetical protein